MKNINKNTHYFLKVKNISKSTHISTKKIYAEARDKFQQQTKLRKEALYLPSSEDESPINKKASYLPSSEDESTSKNKTLYRPSSGDESPIKSETLYSHSDSDSDDNGICDCPTEDCTAEEHNCPICEISKNKKKYGDTELMGHLDSIHKVDVYTDNMSFKKARQEYRRNPGVVLRRVRD